jgi:RNA polymerase sigma-70 factor (ECF subfamily)
MLRRDSRHGTAVRSHADLPWLQPYPDQLLDEVAPGDERPDAVAVDRETIELAFLAAMQVLPPRQRAAFILRDVLGWPAAQTASLLETSVAAANSAVQRARATLQQHLPARRSDWSAPQLTEDDRTLLSAFIDAHERCDTDAMLAMASADLRITMPPYPMRYDGLDVIRPFLERAFGPDRDPDRDGDWRLVPTMANRMPTAASYLRLPGDSEYRAFKFDVLRVVDGRITEITTFGPQLFPVFGLPPVLDRAQ